MTTTFTLEGVPPTATAQQKGVFVRHGRAHFFTKANVKAAERTWREMLSPHREIWRHASWTAPVAVSVKLVFPYLASTPKRVMREGREIPLAKRPDIDNLVKALIDTMTQMQFWRDDGQIYSLYAEKWRGPTPRTEITVEASDA